VVRVYLIGVDSEFVAVDEDGIPKGFELLNGSLRQRLTRTQCAHHKLHLQICDRSQEES